MTLIQWSVKRSGDRIMNELLWVGGSGQAVQCAYLGVWTSKYAGLTNVDLFSSLSRTIRTPGKQIWSDPLPVFCKHWHKLLCDLVQLISWPRPKTIGLDLMVDLCCNEWQHSRVVGACESFPYPELSHHVDVCDSELQGCTITVNVQCARHKWVIERFMQKDYSPDWSYKMIQDVLAI